MKKMKFLFLFAVLTGAVCGQTLLDKCEANYKKCVFDCVQEFTLDETKRKGCEARCKLDKMLCKAREGVNKVGNSLRDFLEGFSKEK